MSRSPLHPSVSVPALLAALLLGACAPRGEGEDGGADAADTTGATAVACTLIGCEDQLLLHLAGAPEGPFRVELQGPGTGDTARRTFDCPAGQRCTDIPFPGFMPERVTVRVVAAGNTTTHELTPVYRTEYPNGPQCPPGCRMARETLAVRAR